MRDKNFILNQKWSQQEIECILCKRSSGCKNCSIKAIYNLKNCKMFQFVLMKFRKTGCT